LPGDAYFNRYYDPDSGQYLSTDPIGLEGGLQTHGYVHDPMQWVDPMGLAGCPKTSNLSRNERWKQLSDDPKLSKSTRGGIKNQIANEKKGGNFKSPPGMDLKHRKGYEAEKGYGYEYADPAWRADHQGIHHRYYRKRGGEWTVQKPKTGGTGKLSLPPKGSLP
jgi:uncharacterized protein RhaS with RHS repeats